MTPTVAHTNRQRALEEALRETRHALIQTVHALSAVTSRSDRYTALHQEQVAALALAIGRRLGLGGKQAEGLYLGALVHDIGKVAVPAELISKPGKLTPEEFTLVRTHVRAGVDMLKNLKFPWPLQAIIGQHHERLDGSGYPNGLAGAAVVTEARITAVADVFEAICQPRPYRAARGTAEALGELERGAGSVYDREAVDALTSLVNEAGSRNFWTYVRSDEFASTVILPQLEAPQAAPPGGNEPAAPTDRPRRP
jgi:putative nucleotidyltransferase with HDIG domain